MIEDQSRQNQKLKIKQVTHLDEQIKVAHRMLLSLVAYLMFVAVAVLITQPKARPPQVSPQPPTERITADHPFGYPRILKYFAPDSCSGATCNQLDNFDLIDFDHSRMTNPSESYQQIRDRNPNIIYLMYSLPKGNNITAYDAGQWYMRDMMDFFETIWVQDNVDWYYFPSNGKTTLRSNIPLTGEDFYITVDNCSDFVEGPETVNINGQPTTVYTTYIRVWNPSNRANYEIMRVEDANGDRDVCEPGNQLYVTSSRPGESGRGRGPSDENVHYSVENVWNYLARGTWPFILATDLTNNRPEWTVRDLIGTDSEGYCGMNNGEKCQITDWLPNYAYDHLFDEDRNDDGFRDFFFNGIFWDVFSYGAHNEGPDDVNVDFEALDELQQNFREASDEIYAGNDLQNAGNQPVDFEDSGMTGGLISERDLASDPYEQNTRNMILEVINRGERWQDVYAGNLPLTLMYCCSYNRDNRKYRFNLIYGNILGAFSGSSHSNGDGDLEFYDHWIDEYAVVLASGEAFIKSQADWNAVSFTGASPERHYLGKPVEDDKELLTTEEGLGENLVSNPGFENGISYWDISTNGEQASRSSVPCNQVPGGECVEGNYALYVDIQNTWGRTANNIIVTNGDLNDGEGLTAGNIYTVEFWAKAANPRVFDLDLAQGWDVDFSIWDLYVGTEWKRFLFTFKADKNVNTIRFLLGRDGNEYGTPYPGIDIYFDNIKIQQGDGFIGYQREFENGLLLLNPDALQNNDPKGNPDIFKVPEGQYKKILGCTGDQHCDGGPDGHNNGDVIDSAHGYTCSGGLCDLEIDALDGYVLLKTGVNAGLDLTLSGAPSVPQGEIYTLTTSVQNNTQDIQTVDVSYNLTFPSGADRDDPVGPYLGFEIDSGQTWQVNDQFDVDTPLGVYTFSATLRDHENQTILDTDTLNVEVSEPEDPYFRQEREPEFRIIGSTTYLWREAERASLTPPMERAEDPEASDGAYILTPDGTGNGNGDPEDGQAQYTINIPESGNWVIWGRVQAPKGADNQTNDSFFVKMDDGADLTWDLFQNAPGPYQDTWGWDEISSRGTGGIGNPEFDPYLFNLTEGTHTLYIKNREDGTKLDKLLITNDLDYVPSGMGE